MMDSVPEREHMRITAGLGANFYRSDVHRVAQHTLITATVLAGAPRTVTDKLQCVECCCACRHWHLEV